MTMERRPDVRVLEAVASARDVAKRARLLDQARGRLRERDVLQSGVVALLVGIFLWMIVRHGSAIHLETLSLIIYAYTSLLFIDHMRMSLIDRRINAVVQLLEGQLSPKKT